MLKVLGIKFASSVLIDSVAETYVDSKKASFKFMHDLGAWEITGKQHGQKTYVYPTNIQFVRAEEVKGEDVEQVSTSSRSRQRVG
jgi:hypothetical protein